MPVTVNTWGLPAGNVSGFWTRRGPAHRPAQVLRRPDRGRCVPTGSAWLADIKASSKVEVREIEDDPLNSYYICRK